MMKKRLFAIAATAFAVSLFVPGKALAFGKGFSLFNSGNESITQEGCADGCKGHDFTGKPGKIYVESGEHTITFDDVIINKNSDTGQDKEAMRIGEGAVVHLILKGNNQIYGGINTAGIIVPKGAVLDISAHPDDPNATLTATSNEKGSASGIGGDSTSGNNDVGKIIINSGSITATGQGGYPGIGTNKNSGEVIINGGIIATDPALTSGSQGKDNYGLAIQCATLSSDSGHFSIIKGRIIPSKPAGLNALNCTTTNDNVFTVIGDVVMPNHNAGGINWETSVQRIDIPSGASLTLPDKKDDWPDKCNRNDNDELIYTGKGNIIFDPSTNVLLQDDIDIIKNEKEIILKLSLTEDDFKTKDPETLQPMFQEGTYTGRDLTESILLVNSERDNYPGYQVESLAGWKKKIEPLDGQKAEGLTDAGKYKVTFEKSGRKVVLEPIIIKPRNLSSDPKDFKIVIPSKVYTGDLLSPDISATYTGKDVPFKQGIDYEMKHNNTPVTGFTDEGSYDIEFTGMGNFTGTTTGTFIIEKAPITNEKTEINITADGKDISKEDEKDTIVYDKTAKPVSIKVKYDGKDLTPKQDYTVKYSGTNFTETDDETKADFTNAGNVTITIEGTNNFQGTVTKSFTIQKAPLELDNVIAVSRTYNGTDDVEIEKVTIKDKGIFGTDPDKDDVSIDPSESADTPVLTAKVKSADIGTYKKLTFDAEKLNAKLTGDQSGNYIIKGDIDDEGNVTKNVTFTLSDDKAVTISTAALAGKPDLTSLTDNIYTTDDYETFDYTVKINNPITDPQFGHKLVYEYKMDNGKWQDEADFTGISPDSTHTFYARTKAVWPESEKDFTDPDNRANIKPGEEGDLEITFKKLPQEEPAKPTLTFEQNEGGVTFTATINLGEKVPEIPGVEYSFDGKDFSDENTKSDCTTGSTYTGYVRYKETATHLPGSAAASDPTSAPQLTVTKPVIKPGSKSFLAGESIEVKITCSTASATIYYTLDGQTPVVGNANTLVYDGTPIQISETTTVRAIAEAPDMHPAEADPATFTKVETSDAQQQYIIEKIDPDDQDSYKIPDTLIAAGLDTNEKITAAITDAILFSPKAEIAPFNYKNIEFFNIKIQFSVDGKTWVDATKDNFPPEGVTISLSDEALKRYTEELKDIDKDSHVFLAAHMFVEDHLNQDFRAGDIEVLDVDETEDSLQFTVNGTSPMAVAWAVGQNPDDNTGDNGNNGNNNNPGDGGNQGDPADPNGNGSGNNNGNTGNNGTNNNGSTANTAGGTDTQVANAAGTNGTDDTSKDGVLDKAKDYLSSLPVTGDNASILLWTVIGVISLVILITVIVKLRKRR